MTSADVAVNREDPCLVLLRGYRDAYEHQRILQGTDRPPTPEVRNLAWYDVLNRAANRIAGLAVYDCAPRPLDVAIWKTLDDAMRKRFLARLEAERAS